ncbi:hypothetical protein SAZ10_07415 [Mesorhizobium sp. BAC0120]|uniref:hypothetical protein n=1 Tax=Mesorhizobium sp. BAC0120 TaxID=3090670 RepID=UPI00298C2433|nr:hypothetical protein [Mesorhizobium sp. BAC0120]MDW6021593.1 hypothetical protein [Mesorhizobium sp. BAC0120]
MELYHRTYATEAIIKHGFRDDERDYLPLHVRHGVWVSDQPLDEEAGALGDVVLVISGVPEADVVEFEWTFPGRSQTVREFLVPAAVLNRFPIVGIYPDSWLWVSGHFEHVGQLIDMRPVLARHEEEEGQPQLSEGSGPSATS